MSFESLEGRHLVLAATGDSIISRRLSVFKEEKFLSMIKILRDADVATTNLETLLINWEEGEQYYGKGWGDGGQYFNSEPWCADELKWAGIDMVGIAINHSLDWGVGGLLSTKEHVERAGLVSAGAGRNLAEARSPNYFDTEKGRVALIAISGSFNASRDLAGDARGVSPGRAGINGVRTYSSINPKSAKKLKEMAKQFGLSFREKSYDCDSLLENEFSFMGREFRIEDGTPEGPVETRPYESDIEANLQEVRSAARQADWVLINVHNHENEHGAGKPARYIQKFARALIDAGADAYLGNGPQVPGGIEIYKGKPIFHSLGCFITECETASKLQPAVLYEKHHLGPEAMLCDIMDAYFSSPGHSIPYRFESFIPVSTLEGEGRNRKLTDMKLYPITMIRGPITQPIARMSGRSRRGRPMLADGRRAREIIEHVKKLSEPYGTQIEFKDGIGLVKLS